jgi:hypothetical protein
MEADANQHSLWCEFIASQPRNLFCAAVTGIFKEMVKPVQHLLVSCEVYLLTNSVVHFALFHWPFKAQARLDNSIQSVPQREHHTSPLQRSSG